MKTKKALLPVLASALLLTMGLAACNTPANNNTTSGGQQSSSDVVEEKIEITSEGNKKEIVVGETLKLTANVEGVSWSTKNTDIVSVSEDGLVTALKDGAARITAKKEGYANGVFTLTVLKAPEREAKYHLGLEQAEHTPGMEEGWGAYFFGTWYSGPFDTPVENNNGATPDGTSIGNLYTGCKEKLTFTSNKAGQVGIGISMAYATEVNLAEALSLKFNGTELSLEGKTTVVPETENNYYEFHAVELGDVNLLQGNNVLEVELIGSSGVNMDEVLIYTADTYELAVVPAVEKPKVTVAETDVKIQAEETAQIVSELTGLTYESANTEVATVSTTGLITGVAAGKTTITVSKENYRSAKVNVTVTAKPVANQVVLEAEDGIIPEGSSIQIQDSELCSGGKSIGYFSDGMTFSLKYTAEKAVEVDLSLVAAACELDMTTWAIKDMDLSTNLSLTLNDAPISLTGKVLEGNTSFNFNNYVEVELGKVNLVQGENTFVLTAITQGPNIDCLKLSGFPSEDELVDNSQEQAGVTYLDFENALLERPEGANEAQNLVVEADEHAHGGQSLGYCNAGNKVTLTFNASAAGKAGLKLTAASTKGSFDWSTFTMSITDHPLADCMTMKLNGADVDLTGKSLPGNTESNYHNWRDVDFGQVDVQAGANTIVIEFTAQAPNFDCFKITGSESVVISLPQA